MRRSATRLTAAVQSAKRATHVCRVVPSRANTAVVPAPGAAAARRHARAFSAAASAEEDDDVVSDEVDLLIVGAGPAGLCAAIRAKQLMGDDVRVLVLEKASEVGAHTLSGAVLEPHAIDELIPDWREHDDFPLHTPVTTDHLSFLTETASLPLPVIPQMHNSGNYIVSLSQVVRWLGERAEELGVEIYPGIAGSEVLFHEDGKSVKGVRTNDVGIKKDGSQGPNYERGMELYARATLFGEGCRGSLTQGLFKKFPELRADCQVQTYGLGVKEVWEVPKENVRLGHVDHTIGWPLEPDTYGGSFTYHLDEDKIAVGFVVGLDYKNPYLSVYQEFQRWKHHPKVASVLAGGKPIAYGARAINEGGYQSIPHVQFPGGALMGCAAGYLNVPKVKGSHLAMKTGILAAEAACQDLTDQRERGEYDELRALPMSTYEESVNKSWVMEELYAVRNIRPSFQKGLWLGAMYSGFDLFVARGKLPFTLSHEHDDADSLKPAAECEPIEYPKADGVLSFDLLESLSRSGTTHNEDQPAHLKLSNEDAVNVNLPQFDNPETRFCPAGVYEILEDEAAPSGKRLQINAQNCLHCKTCDIKDHKINWTVPEGSGGPNYNIM
jgi:electron-transferring-flavoprotein dehydrogenase